MWYSIMQVMQVNYQDLALHIHVQIHNNTPVQQNTIYIDLLLAHLFWRAYKQLKHIEPGSAQKIGRP